MTSQPRGNDLLPNPPIPLHTLSLFCMLAASIYIAMALLSDINDVIIVIRSIPWPLYIILLALSLASYSARLLRWIGFLKRSQVKLSLARHASIYFAGFALTTSPGKVGELVCSFYLKPYGVSYSTSIAAFFSERLLDLIGIMALAAGTALQPDSSFGFLSVDAGAGAAISSHWTDSYQAWPPQLGR